MIVHDKGALRSDRKSPHCSVQFRALLARYVRDYSAMRQPLDVQLVHFQQFFVSKLDSIPTISTVFRLVEPDSAVAHCW